MKKKIEIFYCDLCEDKEIKADYRCQICGKDICKIHHAIVEVSLYRSDECGGHKENCLEFMCPLCAASLFREIEKLGYKFIRERSPLKLNPEYFSSIRNFEDIPMPITAYGVPFPEEEELDKLPRDESDNIKPAYLNYDNNSTSTGFENYIVHTESEIAKTENSCYGNCCQNCKCQSTDNGEWRSFHDGNSKEKWKGFLTGSQIAKTEK